MVFYSISSDSEIKTWKMSQNELNHETMIKLQTPKLSMFEGDGGDQGDGDGDGDEDDEEEMLALCSCFDFNPLMEHLYLIGTEDGHIMECNKTYNDGFTKIYANAHYMNVYRVKWNPFHSKIFISCSEDWTIKLWELDGVDKDKQIEGDDDNKVHPTTTNKMDDDKISTLSPIITYDLGHSVNDIAWSPFSSTIFGAVTSDGRLHIFDLNQNKNAPLCSEQITKKSKNIKLTKIAFPVGFPLVIVGDERGNIFARKLSPNLYLDPVRHREILKNVSPEMFKSNEDFKQKEREKLVNVLSVTGNKVFDLIEHFSPKPVKLNKSMRWKSPLRK